MKKTLLFLSVLCVLVLMACLAAGAACAESAPVLKSQPQDRDLRCNAVFALNVRAEGDNLSFCWQYRDDESAGWTDWETTATGYLYSFAVPEMDQRQVRCTVSNSGGSVTSRVFTLNVLPEITEAWHDHAGGSSNLCAWSYYDIEVSPGDPVRIAVTGYGNGLSWQWYTSRNYGEDWTPLEGQTGPVLNFTAKSTDDGLYLNCVATDVHGNTVSLREKIRTVRMVVTDPDDSDSEITLWFLNDWAREKLALPDDLLQEYDLGGETALILSGMTAEIVNGVIRPAGIQTVGMVSGSASYDCSEGDNVLSLSDGSLLTVHVRDYAPVYAQQVMDDYLQAHITPGMTEYEKAVQCCRFSASYDYDVAHSGSTSMILCGGGDCWAHSDAVLSLLKKLGISAAYHDEREGSFAGHINVMARLDGAYCLLETSYGGTDPESYSIESSPAPFLIRELPDGTAAIRTYLDPEGPADLVIPETVEGLTVTAIDRAAFQARQELRSVTVPETVTAIGEKAFVNCQHLVSARLPASLRELGAVAFGLCYDLQRIEVTEGNPVYAGVRGMLLGKGGTELLTIPENYQGECTVPEGVVSIANSACQNMKFDTFVLPGTIREIGEVVFWGTRINRLILEEGITEIPYAAFANLSVKHVILPRSLRAIGDSAFAQGSISVIDFPEGLETIGESAFEGCWFNQSRLVLPSTLKSIGSRAFLYSESGISVTVGQVDASPDPDNGIILFNRNSDPTFGENVFSRLRLGVWSGSSALDYAVKNGTPYFLLDGEGRTALQRDWFKLATESLRYEDAPLTPDVSLTGSQPQLLLKDVDYLVTYENNDFPGTGVAVVTGIGAWEGSFRYEFRITFSNGFVTDRDGNTYYFDRDGEKATGKRVIDGKTCYFDENGILMPDLPGDVNNDGEVDGRDVIRLMKYLADEIDPETGRVYEIHENNADVTGDGKTDEKDLLRLVRYLAGENVTLER